MIDLKSTLKQHPNCLSSRSAFKSVLMDKYPTEKRIVNILTILFECGVANRIKAKKNIDANEMQALIAQVENEYGISGQYSQEAILVWAAAFDITASTVNVSATHSIRQGSDKQAVRQPIVYVQGSVDEYDIVQRPNGYYITHFNGFEEDEMTIPSLIDGKRIIGIASDAFKGCVGVKSINISEGIEILENRSFKECKSLASISFPSTLKRIGDKNAGEYDGAFYKAGLRKVFIPEGVEYLGPYTFSHCENLRQVHISDGISSIEKRTFYCCGMLSDVKLPDTLITIKQEAFQICLGLREIKIPLGTKEVEECAFANTKMDAVHVPPTVTSIGRSAFVNSPTVYCTAGSVAMEFARKNNMRCAKAQF